MNSLALGRHVIDLALQLADLAPPAVLTVLEGGIVPVGGLGVVPAHCHLQGIPLALEPLLLALVLLDARIVLSAGRGQHQLHFFGVVSQFFLNFRQPGKVLVVEVDIGGGLINQVDGLIGQVPIGDIPLTHGGGQPAHVRADGHLVKGLVIGGDALEDLHRVIDGGLLHDDGLEAALQGGILLDVLAVLREGGGADDLDLTPAQGGFENVGGVHRSLRVTSPHDGVNLVNDKDDVAQTLDLINQTLHPGLKLSPELGTSH